MNIKKVIAYNIVAMLLISLVTACGQYGKLYLPEDAPKATSVTTHKE